jgi:hypothetical protein
MAAVIEEQDDAEERARAQATLPSPLHRTFDQLVDDYAVSAKIHAGEVAIEYDVLADLVRAGWRRVT